MAPIPRALVAALAIACIFGTSGATSKEASISSVPSVLRNGVSNAMERITSCLSSGGRGDTGLVSPQKEDSAPVREDVAPAREESPPQKEQQQQQPGGFWLPIHRQKSLAVEHWWPFDLLEEMGELLGVGRFSNVYSSRLKKTDEEVAVKIIKVKPTDTVLHKRIDREIDILETIGTNERIVHLKEVFRVDNKVGLVFERCYGGELFGILEHIDITPLGERIFVNRTAGAAYPRIPFTEAVIISLLKQVMSVVKFMHGAGIVHRDIKLENVLLTEPFGTRKDGATGCKLIDFGLSKKIEEGACVSACGSAYYAAPEIMACQKGGNRYGIEVDMWAIGVMTYGLLCRQYPFDGEDTKSVLAAVSKGDFDWAPAVTISESARSFVERCLEKDPKKRITVDEAMDHEWMSVVPPLKDPA